jgi:hypothetical protein
MERVHDSMTDDDTALPRIDRGADNGRTPLRRLAALATRDKMLANMLVNSRPTTTPMRQWKHNTEDTL